MSTNAVLLDTDVFSLIFLTRKNQKKRSSHPVDEWKAMLFGRRVVISFQTRAEALFGAYTAGWSGHRVSELKAKLDDTPTIYPNGEIVEACAQLRAAAKRIGHPLGQEKDHEGDRWIAA